MVDKLIKITAVNRAVLMLFAVLFLLCIGCPKTFASQPLIIGIDADMSSVAAEGGNAIYRGAKIAVDEINADGGLLGRPVELVVKDHRGNPARGIRNLKEFSDLDGLLAVLGGVHTPVVLSELDLIHQKTNVVFSSLGRRYCNYRQQQTTKFRFQSIRKRFGSCKHYAHRH